MAHARLRCQSCFAILALAALAAVASAQTPPPAPAGFAWKHIESVKAAFLVPEGWFFKEEEHEGLRTAFFITQEDIDETGRFETGLTVNVQTFREGAAPERAAQWIAGLIQANESQDVWETQAGVLKGFGCRVRKVGEDHPPLILHAVAIGNSRTNTHYVLIFESPEKVWEAAWAKGEKIMKFFLLDDEI